MAVSISTVAALAFKNDNGALTDTVNKLCKVRQALPEKKIDGVETINVQAGFLSNGQVITGGSTYPTAVSNAPQQILTKPVMLLAHAAIPLDAALTVNGKQQAIDLVKNHQQIAFDTLGTDLECMIFDGYLSQVEAAASISGQSATVSLVNLGQIRSGKGYDFVQDGVKVGSGVAGAIVRDGDGTGSVVFSSLVNASGVALTGSVSISWAVYVQGSLSPASGFRFHGLGDACGSGDLYGTTISGANWAGVDTSLSAELDGQSNIRELIDAVATNGGNEVDHLATSRLVFQDVEETEAAKVMFRVGDKLDSMGKNRMKPYLSGVEVIVSDFCPSRHLYAWAEDSFVLGVNRDFASLGDGKGAAIVSEVSANYLIKVMGLFQGLVKNRTGVGRIRDISIDRPGS